MKLNREALAHYLDTAWNKKVADASKAVFEIIGDDIEDMVTGSLIDLGQLLAGTLSHLSSLHGIDLAQLSDLGFHNGK